MKNLITGYWLAYKNHVKTVILSNGNDELKDMSYWRNELFCNILTYIAPLSIIALVPSIYMAFLNGLPIVGFADIVAFVLVCTLMLNRLLTLKQRKLVFISIVYCLSVILLYYLSVPGPGFLFLLALTIIIAIIYSSAAALISAWLNTGICFVFGVLICFKVPVPFTASYSLGAWIAVSSNLVLLSFVCAQCLKLLLQGLETYINDKRIVEGNLTAIFENASEGFILTDRKGVIISFNNRSGRIIQLNIGKEIKMGESIFDYIFEARKANYHDALSKILAGETLQYDYPYYRKDGEIKWFNFTINPVYNEGVIDGLCISTTDITERKEMEQRLSESKTFNDGVLASLSAHIAVIDKDGTIIATNKAWDDFGEENGSHTLERTSKNSNYFDVCRKSIQTGCLAATDALNGIQSVFRKEKPSFEMEYACHSPNEQRWFILRVTNFGTDGTKVVVSHENITERIKAEESLKKTQSNLIGVLENTDAFIYSLDRQFCYIIFNKLLQDSVVQSYGLEIKLGDKVYDFLEKLDPNEARGWEEVYSKALQGEIVKFEKEFRFGEHRSYVSFSIHPIWENEIITGLSCYARDITKENLAREIQQNSEAEVLKVYEEKYTILESIGDAFFSVDKNWTVNYWNKEAERTLCVPKQQIVGKNLWTIFQDSLGSISKQKYHEAIDTGMVAHFEDYYTGVNKWFEISAYPSASGLSVYFTDITKRKSEAEEKAKYIDTIERQNKKLLEIAWIQSHIVRAPLARIMGLVEIMKTSSVEKLGDRIFLNHLVEAADEMDLIIRDISNKTYEVKN